MTVDMGQGGNIKEGVGDRVLVVLCMDRVVSLDTLPDTAVHPLCATVRRDFYRPIVSL